MLVRVRISDGVNRAHPVAMDRRPLSEVAHHAWLVGWNGCAGIPGAAGTLRVRATVDGTTVLEFSGAYGSPGYGGETTHDVFAFRRASALARAYLETLAENISTAIAA